MICTLPPPHEREQDAEPSRLAVQLSRQWRLR